MRRAHRPAQGPAGADDGAPPARGGSLRLRTAEHRGQRQERHRHEPALRQIGAAPAERGDQHLRQRRREGAREAVGRLHDRHRHAAVAHEVARQDRHEHHQPEAVGAERHHDAVQHDHLPQRVGERAGDQAGREQDAAEQDQPARPEPVDQDADRGRGGTADQLRHRIGDRGFAAAPAERLDEGDQEHRVGVHARGTHGEGRERGGEQQTGLTRGWAEGEWGAHTVRLAATGRCPRVRRVCARLWLASTLVSGGGLWAFTEAGCGEQRSPLWKACRSGVEIRRLPLVKVTAQARANCSSTEIARVAADAGGGTQDSEMARSPSGGVGRSDAPFAGKSRMRSPVSPSISIGAIARLDLDLPTIGGSSHGQQGRGAHE